MSTDEEKQLSILHLPLELTASIIEFLDFPTRFAVRKLCRSLYRGEALAKQMVEELALYRTDDDEFTLSLKDNLSETWIFLQNKGGEHIQLWKDDNDYSYNEMKKDSRKAQFQAEETPLGDELSATLQEHLNKSWIDKFTLDGLHCSDSSMAQLCGMLRDKSMKHLHITAPFSTTSDARLYELVRGCPRLRSLKLSIHRCPPKDIVLEKDFLLFAAGRLESLIIHSRGLRQPHSVDTSEVDDELLLRLVADKCFHLELLYFLPLLTASGIVAAVQHLAKRREANVTLKAYFRPELHDSFWRLLADARGFALHIEGFADRKSVSMHLTMRRRGESPPALLFVKTTQDKLEYCKIIVKKEPIGAPAHLN